MAAAVDSAVAKAVEGREKVAIAFSGGLDSSLVALCSSKRVSTVACCAYAEGSGDEAKAKSAAGVLGVEFVGTKLDRERVAEEVASLDVFADPNPMDRALWALFSVTARVASENGAEVILLGQLADELFGGYEKYERAMKEKGEAAAGEMMEADFLAYEGRGRVRDVAACSKWAEPRFPFEDEQVSSLGRSIPVGFKIRNGERKTVLRRAAAILGLDPTMAEAPKKAAQYSSGVLKLIG